MVEDIKQIIHKVSNIELELIELETLLYEELEIDFLDFEEIIMMIEEKYGVDITNEELEDLYCVQDIINLLKVKHMKE